MGSKKLPFALLILISTFAVTFAQSSSYTVSGELRAENGSPFSGATVCAIPVDGSIVRVRDKVCAESDAQGKFIIELPQGGKYQVTAEMMSEGYMPSYIPFYKDPKVPIPEVNLGDENRNVSVSLVLPKNGVIIGKVIDEATDEPVQNFTVWVWQSRHRDVSTHEVVTGINSPGRFRLFVPPVEVTLRVTAEGYEPWVTGGGVLISAAGAKKGPGWLWVPLGKHRDLVVYLKKTNQAQVDLPRPGDATRLPAPVQLNPANNLVVDSLPRTIKLEWNPVTGAVTYSIELEACSNPSVEALSRLGDDGECINPTPYFEKFGLTDTTYEFSYPYAQPARWRVWAVDKDHRPGFKSPWRRWVYPVRIIK